jgi:cbb3-type cytochrome oxidase subunit 3
MGVMTLVFLGSFMAWSWYAWNPKNKAIHEASSLLPLDDSEA